MTQIRKPIPLAQDYWNRPVDIIIDGVRNRNQIIHFAGVNHMGQSVITLKTQSRSRIPIDDWSKVSFEFVKE